MRTLLRGLLGRERADSAKFETRAPDDANALDLFAGHWAADLSKLNPSWPAGLNNFASDTRPALAATALGRNSRLDGMRVLELGPLEAMHTAALERLGAASILAIEANIEAYLKCLVVKEALGLQRARFLLGDFVAYLASTADRFDLVFCCGVLYHLEDPAAAIRNIARVSDRCYVWTHYYSADNAPGRTPQPVKRELDGFSAIYWRDRYRDRHASTFWGGNRPHNSWMAREDLLAAFRHFGLKQIDVLDEDVRAASGPTISFAASRN